MGNTTSWSSFSLSDKALLWGTEPSRRHVSTNMHAIGFVFVQYIFTAVICGWKLIRNVANSTICCFSTNSTISCFSLLFSLKINLNATAESHSKLRVLPYPVIFLPFSRFAQVQSLLTVGKRTGLQGLAWKWNWGEITLSTDCIIYLKTVIITLPCFQCFCITGELHYMCKTVLNSSQSQGKPYKHIQKVD